MAKRFSCQRALELIFEESQEHSDAEEEIVSEYDDDVETNSDSETVSKVRKISIQKVIPQT
ncbi:Uncharacterized protein DAT39_023185 [Clarias magur]|uniref:Uncharacterized protein n=1 Tax=Clarias magur TaxID=1594786 RepID=A0A8J4WYB9_CLAMG|nr:Uncharacterized protein DAT39_023185 [Clarias magur]